MATRKQRAANRRNAQFSTGPKTPEGKAAVRLNALKHGLTAEDAVIFPEDDEAFYELLDTFLDRPQPVGPLETGLFELCLAYVFRDSTAIRRYKAHIERSFDSALHELQRLQADRQRPDPPPPPSRSI